MRPQLKDSTESLEVIVYNEFLRLKEKDGYILLRVQSLCLDNGMNYVPADDILLKIRTSTLSGIQELVPEANTVTSTRILAE